MFILGDEPYKKPDRPTIETVRNFCSKMKNDWLLPTKLLCEKSGTNYRTVRHFKANELTEYRFKVRNGGYVWGNPKTIERFAKYYEQETAKEI